jgi:hypothetical protein
MANNNKGRSSSRTQYGNYYGGYSYGPSSSWSYGSSSSKSHGKKTGRSSAGAGNWSNSAYKTVCNNIERKLDSYKTLFQQAQGGGTHRPTPSTLNSFCNWVNKGAVIQTCSAAQVWRWARTTNKSFNPSNPSPNACKKVLAAKFGRACIKAVAKTKSGQFMVATTPTVNGRMFSFPH